MGNNEHQLAVNEPSSNTSYNYSHLNHHLSGNSYLPHHGHHHHHHHQFSTSNTNPSAYLANSIVNSHHHHSSSSSASSASSCTSSSSPLSTGSSSSSSSSSQCSAHHLLQNQLNATSNQANHNKSLASSYNLLSSDKLLSTLDSFNAQSSKKSLFFSFTKINQH